MVLPYSFKVFATGNAVFESSESLPIDEMIGELSPSSSFSSIFPLDGDVCVTSVFFRCAQGLVDTPARTPQERNALQMPSKWLAGFGWPFGCVSPTPISPPIPTPHPLSLPLEHTCTHKARVPLPATSWLVLPSTRTEVQAWLAPRILGTGLLGK